MINVKNDKVIVINDTEGASFGLYDLRRQLELINYNGDEVLYALIKHGLTVTQRKLMSSFYVNTNEDLMGGLARYGDDVMQMELSTHSFNDVRCLVAMYGDVKLKRMLSLDYNENVRTMAGIYGDEEIRENLVNDESRMVRMTIVPYSGDKIHCYLADDPDPIVRMEVAKYASPRIKRYLTGDSDVLVADSAKRHLEYC